MVNRFGNFLVQRCFEHGTPEQVIKIAEAIRGNTLSLSMDPFGCHVVQKAFDSVPENYKAIMVHELLRRIPETVIHRYACHVWQKLFELRWTESPPQIMTYVNEALRGMWHEVALGETGSLVVQNIFENCLEEDKVCQRCPSAHQNDITNMEGSAPALKRCWRTSTSLPTANLETGAFSTCASTVPLLTEAERSTMLSDTHQNIRPTNSHQRLWKSASRSEARISLGRYLDRVCEGRRDRTRIPLIDIASDQYGNYLIQWILNNATPQHREMVAAHIRKHMVSLRGSKFGSRVGMLCTKPCSYHPAGPWGRTKHSWSIARSEIWPQLQITRSAYLIGVETSYDVFMQLAECHDIVDPAGGSRTPSSQVWKRFSCRNARRIKFCQFLLNNIFPRS